VVLELDHVFVAAAYEGPEMELLTDAGFLEGPENDHPGQGTASRGVFFENAYLELIWLTDAEVARSPAIQRTRLADRLDPTRAGNPVGIGLRSPADPVPPAPFGTWPFAPPYLPSGAAVGSHTRVGAAAPPQRRETRHPGHAGPSGRAGVGRAPGLLRPRPGVVGGRT
jgi:hypothetical protein